MIKNRVYMDNGATSYPKAPNVAKVMSDYIINNGSNVSRGAYKSSLDASRVLYNTREMLTDLFNFDHIDHVVFTKNITESMNVLLKGYLTKDDHVIISSLEHNAVIRPLNRIGCDISMINVDEEGFMKMGEVEPLIQKNTKAIVCMHGSNVSGTVNDLALIGRIAKENNLKFIVDAAQTAGVLNIDMKKSHIDALAFTGHKSLLGPTGIGGFLIEPEFAKLVTPLIDGGTGSDSESEIQPEFMPDKFESGTPNVVGVFGLNEGLKYIKEVGIDEIYAHEMILVKKCLNHFEGHSARLVGPKSISNRTAVVSLDFIGYDNAVIAFQLEKKFNIASRVGMHCAPLCHKALDTYPNGTIRFSFSYFNTEEEVAYLFESIDDILNSYN